MGSNFLTRRSAVKVLGGAGLSILGSSLVGCSQQNGKGFPKVITPKSVIESDQKTVWFSGAEEDVSVKKEVYGFFVLGQNTAAYYELNKALTMGDVARMSDEELVKKATEDFSQSPESGYYKLTLLQDKTGNDVEAETLGFMDYYFENGSEKSSGNMLGITSETKKFGTIYDFDFVGFTEKYVYWSQKGPREVDHEDFKVEMDSESGGMFTRIPKGTSSNYSFKLDSLDSGIEVK
ncbi:hypothetical protein [Lancefieldella rimae]|uniref:hypothetical protein n=1 Tax=Lancefieldella rimae TaxID=1383 RepID=UPI00288BEE1A|nr:hypothetical protein [Lancefieldella rimae]